MKTLFNDGWEFTKQPLHTTYEAIMEKQKEFEPVGLPHDWLIYQTGNLYEDSTGWYRKRFVWSKQEKELVFLRFDGIYMDSKVYVNGKKVREWKYGYSAFETEITENLVNGENEILVSADFQAPNSRWYSGAGIYRNVWIRRTPVEHFVADGIYFSAKKETTEEWSISIHTEVEGQDLYVEYALREKGSEIWEPLTGNREPLETGEYFKSSINNPKIWDVEHPFCYELAVTLKKDQEILQREVQTVGFRTLDFSPETGFSLNGRKLKLNGVCEHHDLGCLGAAYHSQAMRRKLEILKKMGVNAIRTAHNMPAQDLMELTDEMGILVVSEAFDCWESPKNPYDYARFFPQWYQKDVESWIRRDRNHPSLIMWSIGNEIYDTHVSSTKGKEWMEKLIAEVRRYDSLKNAAVTLGSNYMPWENTQKCADVIKLIGYNYGENYYEEHHEKHPDWMIYGSETGSIVQSRGIYHFPYQQSVLADEDEQCSSLGNSTTSWGAKSTEACILAERDHPYSCGQFIWTGFDYIGEPTPYHTRNSYFGQIDTAGFPKDSYYIYQAAWTDYKKAPMVHIFPYWDFNEGQFIDLRVCSNAPVVEVFFNGKSQGTFTIDHENGMELTGHWQLPYKEGEIRAVACDESGRIVAEEVRYSFGEAKRILLKPQKQSLRANGEDLLFLEISMEDENGYPVENANNRVLIQTEGAGALVGTDNGDSTDTEEYKKSCRRLFSGKLLAVFKAGTEPG
ncbi:MAG: glycoside hydrolase family 2 TIM barrel-domain containing protein, partial [Blautia producta]